jgi:peptidoglycan/LPS O-acetylase OafA/YrhL
VYRQFLWARLIRFYPSYLAAFLVLMALVAFARVLQMPIAGDYRLSVLPARLAMLQAWPFMSWTLWSWNFPTWFLSALWFGYLFAVPLIWKCFPKLRGSPLAPVCVVLPLLVSTWILNLPGLVEFQAVVRACCGFFAGAALFEIHAGGGRIVAACQKYLDRIVLFFLGCFALLVSLPSPVAGASINLVLLLGCPALLLGLTSESSLFARMLATRPMLSLGKISLALFLSHAVVLKILKVILPAERFSDSGLWVRYGVLTIYEVVLYIAAKLLFHCVEQPCARALKDVPARKAAAPAEEACLLQSTQPEPD